MSFLLSNFKLVGSLQRLETLMNQLTTGCTKDTGIRAENIVHLTGFK